MVETGLIGTLFLVFVLLRNAAGHFRQLLVLDRSPGASLLFLLTALLIVRSFVEIDVMHPYHVGSFLLYFAAGRLTLRQRQQEPVPASELAKPKLGQIRIGLG
ncbi:Uncharacterised protein [Mycobacterium tuberculosis]|nr:Uncharacterised protein [Mycobacterium tuberculosis]